VVPNTHALTRKIVVPNTHALTRKNSKNEIQKTPAITRKIAIQTRTGHNKKKVE